MTPGSPPPSDGALPAKLILGAAALLVLGVWYAGSESSPSPSRRSTPPTETCAGRLVIERGWYDSSVVEIDFTATNTGNVPWRNAGVRCVALDAGGAAIGEDIEAWWNEIAPARQWKGSARVYLARPFGRADCTLTPSAGFQTPCTTDEHSISR